MDRINKRMPPIPLTRMGKIKEKFKNLFHKETFEYFVNGWGEYTRGIEPLDNNNLYMKGVPQEILHISIFLMFFQHIYYFLMMLQKNKMMKFY